MPSHSVEPSRSRTRNARVVAVRNNGLIRVELEPEATRGEASRTICTVHLSGAMRVRAVRVLPGDGVLVEVSPFDPTKGRIVGLVD